MCIRDSLTTTLGAAVGFTMLWWMLFSCWSKSVLQAELGRCVISSGETGLVALNRVPGKIGRVSWVVAIWLFILIPSHLSGGGIYGGMGQAVHQALPMLPSTGWTLIFASTGVAIVLSVKILVRRPAPIAPARSPPLPARRS